MNDVLIMQSKPGEGELAREDSVLRRVPLSMVQKTMAKRMLESAREIPQFSVSRELNAELLESKRNHVNSQIDGGFRVSVTAILIWLTARALRKHPRMNSRFDGEASLQYERVNMSVAMDTPAGLVAPVIFGAEMLSVVETAAALKDLTARAAAKRLAMKDFADATFTISNLGMLGVCSFAPLVNPPQGAIMGVGGPRLAARLDKEGRLIPVRTIEVTVTADHRILDGAEVARFLKTLADSIETNASI